MEARIEVPGSGPKPYNSEPRPIFDKFGNCLLSYYSGTAHASSNAGRIMGKISTNDCLDFGPEFVIADHPSGYDTRNHSPAYDADTHTHTMFFRTSNGSPSSGDNHIDIFQINSFDGGVGWTDPVSITALFPAVPVDFISPFGAAVQTSNGLMQLFVARKQGVRQYIWALFSTDGGRVWGDRVTLLDAAHGLATYTEPFAIRLDDDRIVVLIRNNASGFGNRYCWLKSSDGGSTWSSISGAAANWTSDTSVDRAPICGYRTSDTEVTLAWGSRSEADGRGYLYLQKISVEAFFSMPQLGFDPSLPRSKFYVSKVMDSNPAGWSEWSYPLIFGNGEKNFITWYDSRNGSNTTDCDIWISSLC